MEFPRSRRLWSLVLLIILLTLPFAGRFIAAGASISPKSNDLPNAIPSKSSPNGAALTTSSDSPLINPGFEGGQNQTTPSDIFNTEGTYIDSITCPEITTPNGWTVFFRHGLPVPWDGRNTIGFAQPEVKVIEKIDNFLDPPRIHSEQWALQLFTFWKIHDAGLYQQVQVSPGSRWQLSAWVHTWTSDDDDPYHSTTDDPNQAWQMVGLDPTGGTNPFAPTVVWSAPENHIYDVYTQTHSVTVTAKNNTLTVFLRSGVKWPFKHNDVYWDTVTLERALHSTQMHLPIVHKGVLSPTAPPQVDPPPLAPGDAAFGVVFVNPAQPGMPVDAGWYAKAADLGIGWDRWPLYWYHVEPSAGQYNWSAYDAVVEADLSHGLQVNPILMGTPGFYATGGQAAFTPALGFRPPPYRIDSYNATTMSPPSRVYEPVFADGSDVPAPGKAINPNNPWANLVFRAVERYRPGGLLAQQKGWPSDRGVRVWEIWNEPDLSLFWGGSVGDYARLLKVAALAARQADPNAVIMVGGLANPPAPGYLAALLAHLAQDPDPGLRDSQGWYFDTVALHNYAWSWDTGERIRQARRVIDEYQTNYPALADKPVWINESGVAVYDDYPGPTWQSNGEAKYMATMEEQAAFAIQNAAYALYNGAQVIFHFQLYDGCGNDPAGTDFPPDALYLCHQGQICASASAFGLWRNKPTDSCYRQHPVPDTSRSAYGAFRTAVRTLTGAQPVWHQQPDGDQEWFAFYRPDVKQRVVVLWARHHHDVIARVPVVASQAVLLDQYGGSSTLYPNNGRYTITLPAATNLNLPLPPDGSGSIGGRPVFLIENWSGPTD